MGLLLPRAVEVKARVELTVPGNLHPRWPSNMSPTIQVGLWCIERSRSISNFEHRTGIAPLCSTTP